MNLSSVTHNEVVMSQSFQGEVPKARVNLKLDLHTGNAQKNTELPLNLLIAADFSNDRGAASVIGRNKIDIIKKL
jgi:type VI secretion system protein ImpB